MNREIGIALREKKEESESRLKDSYGIETSRKLTLWFMVLG